MVRHITSCRDDVISMASRHDGSTDDGNDGFIPYSRKNRNLKSAPSSTTTGVAASSSSQPTVPQNAEMVNDTLKKGDVQLWSILPFDAENMTDENYGEACLKKIDSDSTPINIYDSRQFLPEPVAYGCGLAMFVNDKKPDWADYQVYKMIKLNLIYPTTCTLESVANSPHFTQLWVDTATHFVQLLNEYGARLVHGVKLGLVRGGGDPTAAGYKEEIKVCVEFWFEPETNLLTAGFSLLQKRELLQRAIQHYCGRVKKSFASAASYSKKPTTSATSTTVVLPRFGFVRTRTIDQQGKPIDDD